MIVRTSLAALACAVACSVASPVRADETTLTLLASAPEKPALAAIVAAYQKAHPGTHIVATYLGGSIVASEVNGGSQVDVVVVGEDVVPTMSANIEQPRRIATMHAAILVNKGASNKIASPKDLVKPGIRLGFGAKNSSFAQWQTTVVKKLAKLYGSDFEKKFEANVTFTALNVERELPALRSGTIDAGLAYASSAEASSMNVIALPPSATYVTSFDVAVVKASSHVAAARDFAAFVAGPDGIAIHRSLGVVKDAP